MNTTPVTNTDILTSLTVGREYRVTTKSHRFTGRLTSYHKVSDRYAVARFELNRAMRNVDSLILVAIEEVKA